MAKATITEVTVNTVTVQYEDGSVATIPINKNLDLKSLTVLCFSYYHEEEPPFDKVSDVPVKVGDSLDDKLDDLDDEVSYIKARQVNYPSIGSQLDALYWERQGDDTERKIYDARIQDVKDKIPKGKTYKRSELNSLLEE